MLYWVSPFPLDLADQALLEEAGLSRWMGSVAEVPDGNCLLLYNSPDQLISSSADTTPELLLKGYRIILDWFEQNKQPLLATWQLQQLGSGQLNNWLVNHSDPPLTPQPDQIAPLVAVVVSKLIDAEPDLIDAYKDLELRAQLLGREPDLNYQQRLRQVSNQELALLQALRQPNAIAALELQLQEKDRQLKQLQEEVDLALSQLDQVQEELEHYFLLNRGLQQLIDRHEQLERRSERLLAGLIKF